MLEGYTVGGSRAHHRQQSDRLHHRAARSHSSRFASDLAKRLPIPIFHVNAEDPDAVVRVGRMAARLSLRVRDAGRDRFDRLPAHGHSEVDDPTITQPLRYRKIRGASAALADLRRKDRRRSEPHRRSRSATNSKRRRKQAVELEKNPPMRQLPAYWNAFPGRPLRCRVRSRYRQSRRRS